MKTIITILLIWLAVSAPKWIADRASRKRSEQAMHKIREEQRRAKLEAVRIREEFRHQREVEKEHTRRMVAIEKEQVRQAEQLAKHEAEISKLKYRIEQAEDDINFFLQQYEQMQEYSKYLEEQRSKCADGTAEYHKWNNKALAQDAKVYKVRARIYKAEQTKREAELKLEAA